MEEFICMMQDNAELLNVVVTLLLAFIGFIIGKRSKRIQETLAWDEYRKPILEYANEVVNTFPEA